MEENKSKEIKMNPNKETKKLSYEELKAAATKLSDDNRMLKSQINQILLKMQEMNVDNMIERIKLLFKVVEYRSSFNAEFVVKCVREIESLLTLPDKEEKTEDNKK